MSICLCSPGWMRVAGCGSFGILCPHASRKAHATAVESSASMASSSSATHCGRVLPALSGVHRQRRQCDGLLIVQQLLWDFLNFWTWQHPKRSNSARLSIWTWQRQKRSYSARHPQFSKLGTSKTKQFCETSFKKWKVECGLVPLRLRFSLHLSKALRLPQKNQARLYEVLHLSRKIILANLKIQCSKMQPLSWIQRPDLLTSLMNMSLVLRPPRKMHLCRSSSKVPRLPSFFEMPQNPHDLLTFGRVQNPLRLPHKNTSFQKCSENGVLCTFWLRNVLRATTACTFSTSQFTKVLRGCSALYILTAKWSSRHKDVHFFNISTSKSAPDLVCFVHFDFEMCFAPQQRALFQHLNF